MRTLFSLVAFSCWATVAAAKAPAKIEACPALALTDRLREAIVAGDVAGTKRALADGARVNCWLDAQDETPLGAALRAGQLAVATALVDAGADVNAKRPGGCVPLWAVFAPAPSAKVAAKDRTALLSFLIQRGADRNARCSAGGAERPLVSMMVAERSVADLEAFLTIAADVAEADAQAPSTFELAVQTRATDASDADIVRRLELLSAKGALPPVDVRRAEALLDLAVTRCQRATFARLERVGLHWAAGSASATRAVPLAAGCGDVRAFDAALALAKTPANDGAPDQAKDANKDTSKGSAIVVRALETLLTLGARADVAAATTLIGRLLPAATPLVGADALGRTPLMLSALAAHKPLFDAVAGADQRIDAVDREGHGVGWHAALGGSKDILGALAANIDLAKAATPALLPLQAALGAGQADALAWLLAQHRYPPETLGAVAATASKRLRCGKDPPGVLDALVHLVDAGANPLAIRAQLACYPDVDRTVADIAERRVSKAGDERMKLVVWGEGKSGADAERWVDSYKRLRAAMAPWIAATEEMPRRLPKDAALSDKQPGDKQAGAELVVIAACPEPELQPMLKTWLGFNPGISLYDVSWPKKNRACPWLLAGNPHVRAAGNTVKDDATLAIAVLDSAVSPSARALSATLIGKDGGLRGIASESFDGACGEPALTQEVIMHPKPSVLLRCRRGQGPADWEVVYTVDAADKPLRFKRAE